MLKPRQLLYYQENVSISGNLYNIREICTISGKHDMSNPKFFVPKSITFEIIKRRGYGNKFGIMGCVRCTLVSNTLQKGLLYKI